MTLTMHLHSIRWGHPDEYALTWTPAGWDLRHGGATTIRKLKKDGTTVTTSLRESLRGVMRNDAIHPPDVLDTAMSFLWDAIDGGLPEEKAQQALAELGDWINVTMRHSPARGMRFWSTAF